jgi:hypothetical protein
MGACFKSIMGQRPCLKRTCSACLSKSSGKTRPWQFAARLSGVFGLRAAPQLRSPASG